MQITVSQRDRGFTLVEILVAFSILTIGILAILNGLMVTVEHNLSNLVRDEAVRIAEEKINELRGMAFSSIEGGKTEVSRNFRNLNVRFQVSWQSEQFSKTKEVEVKVEWELKGRPHSYVTRTFITLE